ncbi:MAG: hypothetical protein H5T96_09335 [Tissierellales bacterium]|nr:hypothetical protein [Tissierellales bacterium]
MKNKFYEFDPVLYPVKLYIVLNPTDGYVKKNFLTSDKKKLRKVVDKNWNGGVYLEIVKKKSDNGFGILVFVETDDFTPDMVTHEAVHVSQVFWEWLCETKIGDEADAYFTQWVAKCIIEAINKQGNGKI